MYFTGHRKLLRKQDAKCDFLHDKNAVVSYREKNRFLGF